VSKQNPTSTHDLRPSERRFLGAMRELGHGRFESLRILDGELILDPWPATVRSVKFGGPTAKRPLSRSAEFELKSQIAEFFSRVRCIDSAVIRVLEVRVVCLFGWTSRKRVVYSSRNGKSCQYTFVSNRELLLRCVEMSIRPLFPLFAAGADASFLEGPLSAINAISCDSQAQLHQLIDDIGAVLSHKPDRIAGYQKCITELVEESRMARYQHIGEPTAIDGSAS